MYCYLDWTSWVFAVCISSCYGLIMWLHSFCVCPTFLHCYIVVFFHILTDHVGWVASPYILLLHWLYSGQKMPPVSEVLYGGIFVGENVILGGYSVKYCSILGTDILLFFQHIAVCLFSAKLKILWSVSSYYLYGSLLDINVSYLVYWWSTNWTCQV